MRSVARPYRRGVFIVLGVALAGCILLSLCIGAVRIPPAEVGGTLLAKLRGAGLPNTQEAAVLWHLRLPRTLLALLVGATLGVAGALTQGLLRNPLADPALIGVSSGAAMGTVFVIVFAVVWFPTLHMLAEARYLPIAAFAGALAMTFVILRLADTSGYTAVTVLLLAGIALNAIAGAFIGLATFLATDVQLRSLQFWLLGSLGSADWGVVGIATPFALALLGVALWFAPALNALTLGEAEAAHLGFAVERVKRILVVAAAAGVGVCVAFTGVIGFVGLVVPHLVRLWIGPDHRWLVPGSALIGGALLLLADTVARVVVAPAELPIGILAAALGGPFFLFMLLRQRNRFLWS